jgi:Zn finger protein HypA/HybF involved in hydrogenase expression
MNDETRLAHNRCWECEHEWKERPNSPDCPACGSKYFSWLNYREWKHLS